MHLTKLWILGQIYDINIQSDTSLPTFFYSKGQSAIDHIFASNEIVDGLSEQLRHSAADTEAKGQHLVAERLAKRAQRSSSEAIASRVAGWTQWF